MTRTASPRLPLLLCLACALLQIAVFHPGYVSYDVLSQLDQARLGVIDDVSPPAAALLFQLGERLLGGTAAVYLLNALLFWGGCALLWRALRLSTGAAIVAMLLALPLLLLLPHVWTDLHLLSVLAMFTGIVATLRQQEGLPRALLWLLAFGLLGWATWVRHNAILAVLPLAWLLLPPAMKPGKARRLATWLAMAVVLVGLRSLSVVAVDHRTSVWAVTPMWDLQALSITSGEMLFPAGFVGPDMTVAELRSVFSENTGVPLFEAPGGVRNPTVERFTADTSATLLRAWGRALLEHPSDWIRHRLRVFLRLFGPHHENDLMHMVDSPRFAPDAARARWQETLHGKARRVLEHFKLWGGAAAGLFLLAALALWTLGACAAEDCPRAGRFSPRTLLPRRLLGRDRQPEPDVLPACLLFSAVIHTGALLPLAPSAELRYLAWPLWACAVAAAITWRPKAR
ncbi:MAG: hypothetical protein R3F10_13145 [Lysobacteraceae bacterium]